MWRNYLSIAIALGGSLILSVAVTACGTNPAWLTVTAETQEKAIDDAVGDAVDATMSTIHEASTTAEAEIRWATTDTKITATAIFREANPPTPRPPRQKSEAMGESVPGWLITDTENITSRMYAIQPYLHSCPFTSSERSSYIRRLDRFTADANAAARDMSDGFIDDYSIEELVSITNNGFEIVSELELKCR